MRRTRLVLLLGLVLAASPLLGCRQASCVWDNTCESVKAALPQRCCPDPCGNVYADPIYSGGCAGGDNLQSGGGTGAFAR